MMTHIQYVYSYFHNGVCNRHVILYNYRDICQIPLRYKGQIRRVSINTIYGESKQCEYVYIITIRDEME
jgi:hypothetical protein